MDSICLKAGICGIAIPGSCHVTTAASLGRSAAGHAMPVEKDLASVAPYKRSGPSGFSFKYPLRSLWPGGGRRYDAIALDDAVVVEERAVDRKEGRGREGGDSPAGDRGIGRNGKGSENWVLKILQVGSVWGGEGKDETEAEERQKENEENDDLCRVENEGDDDDRIEFDRSSFSKLLRRVSLAEARLYTRMSYLGNLAYCIPQIKPKNLLKFHGMRFVTSSLEKKEMVVGAEKEQAPAEAEVNDETSSEHEKSLVLENKGSRISPSAAYQIAASAASYLHAHTKSIISFKSSKSELTAKSSEENCETNGSIDVTDDEMASLMATTDSMTAVVAAKEEVKQAVADDLNSACSSPCEWFICDDDISHTRYFVIQGSESIASWQANLLFEPIQFEGLDVPVHRGIYEAAKGIYEQLLPEVCAHLKSHGDRALFRFTGHSLGGSLSLLINLMLLRREVVPPSSLLPVITFGAPSIMCGGDRLLQELGLPRSHVQSITMHRDIVPRAFSCNYPNHVAELLKAVNGNFRDHPCLKNEKLLYAPMGVFLILQPDEKYSPNHELLPPGSGLYLLTCPASDVHEGERQLRAAQSVFLNSPHPLEILSDRSAYGSDGTVQRDHDMSLYLKSIRSVVRQELNQIRRARRTHRRKFWWPLVTLRALDGGTLEEGIIVASREAGPQKFDFSGIFQTGRRYLTHFSRLVASQNVHLLVVLLFPARLLVFSTYSLINLGN